MQQLSKAEFPVASQQRKTRESRCCSMPTSRVMFGSETGPYDKGDALCSIYHQKQNGLMSRCSGVLFNPSLVLTCAHCWEKAEKDGDGSMAYAGIEDGQSVEEGVSKKVISFVLHPAFRLLNGAAFDLAAVEVLPFELVLGKLGTIGFPRFEPVYTSSQWVDCQIAGSGQSFTKSGNRCENTKRWLYMTGVLTPLSCCNDASKPPDHIFPMGTTCLRGHSDAACAGDSGSGVVCKYEPSGDRVLVGILRADAQCCDKNGAV